MNKMSKINKEKERKAMKKRQYIISFATGILLLTLQAPRIIRTIDEQNKREAKEAEYAANRELEDAIDTMNRAIANSREEAIAEYEEIEWPNMENYSEEDRALIEEKQSTYYLEQTIGYDGLKLKEIVSELKEILTECKEKYGQ